LVPRKEWDAIEADVENKRKKAELNRKNAGVCVRVVACCMIGVHVCRGEESANIRTGV
jgi:hypothetical protein